MFEEISTPEGRMESYDAEHRAETEGPKRARLGLAHGLLLESRASHREALRRYEEAFHDHPGSLPARRAIRRLYRVMDQPHMLVSMYGQEAGLEPEDVHRARFRWLEGQELERLGKVDDACDAYLRACEACPGFLPALYCVEPLLRARDEWGKLAGLMEAAVGYYTERLGDGCPGGGDQGADPESLRREQACYELAALLGTLGRLYEVELGDVERAFDCHRRAATLLPSGNLALASLERLCRSHGRWEELALVLERQAELSDAGPSGAAVMLEAARIRRVRLGDREGAVSCLERGLGLDPGHVPTLQTLADLLQERGDVEGLARVLDRWAEVEADPRERADLLVRSATILQRLDLLEGAVERMERALETYPSHRVALRFLGEYYRQEERYEDMVEMYLAEARHSPDPAHKAVGLLRAAEMLDARVGDRPRAIQVLKEALETGPDRLAVTRVLARLLKAEGRWEDLARILSKEADRTTDPELAVLHLRDLAGISEEHLGDLQAAAGAHERILQVAPSDEASLDALIRIYRALGRHEDLIRVLVLRSETAQDSRAVAALLSEAAHVADDGLSDEQTASRLYDEALKVHPGYVPALEGLGRILSVQGRWRDLVEMHERNLDVTDDPVARAGVHYRVADILWHRLGDMDGAVAHLTAALEDAPDDLNVLEALEGLARERGDWAEVARLVGLRAGVARHPSTRALLWCRQGATLESLPGAQVKAREAYARAIEEDPGFAPAYRSLIRMAQEAGRWDEVVELVDRLYAVEPDGAQGIQLLMHKASVQWEQLGRPDLAMETYRKVLELDAGHPGALRSLEELLRRQGGREALAGVLESRARTIMDPLIAGAYFMERLEAIQGTPSGDVDGVEGPGDTTGPREEERLDLAMDLLKAKPWHHHGLELLEGLLLARGDHGAMADLYARAVKRFDDPDTVRDIQLRRAAHLAAAGRVGEAEDLLAELVALDPEDLPALKEYQALLLARGDLPGLLEAIEQEGGIAKARPRVAKLLVEAARAWLDLGERERARSAFEQALRTYPDEIEALEGLEALLRELGEAHVLPELLEELLPLVETPEGELELHLRLARRDMDQGDLDASLAHLSAALSAVPGDLRATEAEANVLYLKEAYDGSVDAWQRVLKHPDATDEQRMEARRALGAIWGVRLGQTGRALEVLDQVLAAAPDDEPTLVIKQMVLLLAERWHELERVFRKRLELAEGEAKADIYMDWAEIEDEQRLNHRKALDLYERARQAAPEYSKPVEALWRLYLQDRAYDKLERLVYEYHAALSERHKANVVPLLMKLGELMATPPQGRRGGRGAATMAPLDLNRAIKAYELARKIDPQRPGIHLALARLYAKRGDTMAKAVDLYMAELEAGLSPELLEGLLAVFRNMRMDDRASVVWSLMVYSGVAAMDSRTSTGQLGVVARGGYLRGGLDSAAMDRLMVTDASRDLLDWLELLSRFFPKLYARYGPVRAYEARKVARGQDSVANVCHLIGESFGIVDFHVYRFHRDGDPERGEPSGRGLVKVDAFKLPAVLVAHDAQDHWNAATERFLLARAIASFYKGAYALTLLGEEALSELIRASEWLDVSGSPEGPLARPYDLLHGVVRKKAVRRGLAGLANELLSRGDEALTEAFAAIKLSFDRAGTLHAGDLDVALRELVGPPEGLGEGPDEVLAALSRDRASFGLVEWALSDEFAGLRAALRGQD